MVAGAQDDKPRVLARGSPRELRVIAEILREETVGGLLLLLAAVAALVWANSPWSAGYAHLVTYRFGPSALLAGGMANTASKTTAMKARLSFLRIRHLHLVRGSIE